MSALEGLPDAPLAAGRVLIVILNFNGICDTLECLESLRGQTWRNMVVLVIDNGSTADDLSPIATRFPDVNVVALPENLGWAGGNNVGIRRGLEQDFDYVCLLNNDTVLDPTAIEKLLIAAAVLGRPCLLHPAIAYFDEPEKWQLNPPPLPLEIAAVREFEATAGITEMNLAYGACLFLPASVLKSVGLLDERFFLQLEETDYYWRAKALGIGSFCARHARILHKESVSFGGTITSGKTYYQVRNSFLLAQKHACSVRGFLHALRLVVWALRNRAGRDGGAAKGWLCFLRWMISGDPMARAVRHGARDFILRRFGRRPTETVAL
jgi:GT2 family glycosyltransferase